MRAKKACEGPLRRDGAAEWQFKSARPDHFFLFTFLPVTGFQNYCSQLKALSRGMFWLQTANCKLRTVLANCQLPIANCGVITVRV
jgi:hypothetical protein